MSTSLYYSIRLINIFLFLLLLLLPFSTYLWYKNFGLDSEYYKNDTFKQKIGFESADFWELHSPENEWQIRIYNVDEINFLLSDEDTVTLSSKNQSSSHASFNSGYRTVEVNTSRKVVNTLFNSIFLYRIVSLLLLFFFVFFLRRILIAAKHADRFSKRVIGSFRWMALILVAYCFIPKSDADVLMNFVSNNFEYGHISRLFNSRGLNVNVLLIIGSLCLLCLAESFRVASAIKEEQDLTV